jgi:hypothetical protein
MPMLQAMDYPSNRMVVLKLNGFNVLSKEGRAKMRFNRPVPLHRKDGLIIYRLLSHATTDLELSLRQPSLSGLNHTDN